MSKHDNQIHIVVNRSSTKWLMWSQNAFNLCIIFVISGGSFALPLQIK